MMRHLLSIEDLDRPAIERILDRAKTFTDVSEREIKKVPALRGRRVLNLFYEASTRTRSSFELAAKSLSADVINFAASGSSVDKGESLKDTVQTMSAYRPDLIVIRTPYVGAAWVPAADAALDAAVPAGSARVFVFENPAWPAVAALVEESRRDDEPVCVKEPALAFLFTQGMICTPVELASGTEIFASIPSGVRPDGAEVAFRNDSIVLSVVR